jgi:hypothetical protein
LVTACSKRPQAPPDAESSSVAEASVLPPPARASADEADAATTIASDAGPATVSWSLSYRGVLGERTHIDVNLNRSNERLTGSILYGSPRSAMLLVGELRPDGTMVIDERKRGGQGKTGTLELRTAPDGTLSGAWRSATDTKSYRLRLSPRGVNAASRADFLDFCVRLTRKEHKPLSRTEIDRRLAPGEDPFGPHEFDSVLTDHGLAFERASLYIADVNNDGTRDFVLIEKNLVSTHNDMLFGVFDEDGDALKDVSDFAVRPEPTYRDAPFIEVTPEGTVTRWTNLYGVDESGEVVRMIDPCANMVHEHFVFLLRGKTQKTVSHEKWLEPCR